MNFNLFILLPHKGKFLDIFEYEALYYSFGGLITVVVAALLMHYFIYIPVTNSLKKVKPDNKTPFSENEGFYAQYIVWCAENGKETHFLKREVPVEAVYDDEDNE